MTLEKLKIGVVGLGYFSQFHLASWQKMAEANLVAVCDTDAAARNRAEEKFKVPAYPDTRTLLEAHDVDILDVVAPPPAHADLIRLALKPGRTLICQKPFCTSLEEAQQVTEAVEAADTRLVIHENFRFQPWHRELKRFLEQGGLGTIFQARFALRPGDGRGTEAYLARQPAFRQMERFLVHETGVHFIDLFAWLLGPITSVYADLRQLNPNISGEDAGYLIFSHQSGARSIFDANRLSDNTASDPRRTMGEMEIDGEKGTVRLNGEGDLTFRAFGQNAFAQMPLRLPVDTNSFGGGCVHSFNKHVVDALIHGAPLENEAREYLQVIRIDEAAYESSQSGERQTLMMSEI